MLFDIEGTVVKLKWGKLCAHIKLSFQFPLSRPFSPESTGCKSSPKRKDEVHAVAVLLDATAVTNLPEETRHEIAHAIGMCLSKGIQV